jgi:hypothetical protein
MQASQQEQSSFTSLSSAEPEICAVDPKVVPLIWGAVASHLERALDRTSKAGLDDTFDLCVSGMQQLWIITDCEDEIIAALVTCISTFQNGTKALCLLNMGGDGVNSWSRPLMNMLDSYAEAEGCTSVEFRGRKGWGHIYPEFELIEYVYSKDI